MPEESHEEVEARVRARKADKEKFSGPGIRIEVVLPKDLDRFRQPLEKLWRAEALDAAPSNAGYVENHVRMSFEDFSHSKNAVLMASLNGEPVGYVELSRGVRAPRISYVYVMRKFRQRFGVGKLLETKTFYRAKRQSSRQMETTGPHGSVQSQGVAAFRVLLQRAGGLSARAGIPKPPIRVLREDNITPHGKQLDFGEVKELPADLKGLDGPTARFVERALNMSPRKRARRLSITRNLLIGNMAGRRKRYDTYLRLIESTPVPRKRIRRALTRA